MEMLGWDDGLGYMWGDAGVLYILVRREALKRGAEEADRGRGVTR